MRNEEILRKALQKSLDNGWLNLDGKIVKAKDLITSEIDIVGAIKFRYIDESKKINTVDIISPFNSVILSHSFAKAFWGEEDICIGCETPTEQCFDDGHCKICDAGASWDDDPGDMDDLPAWKYHLQQMVLAEDPIKYLEKFI